MKDYDYNKVDDFIEKCRIISASYSKTEAFKLITNEINDCSDRYLNDFIGGLNFIQYEKSLDWIELNVHRIRYIRQDWGHLAASSHFSWERASKWLSMGRPLSLIALDGLMFCTTIGERLNQSPWMQELNPRLRDNPKLEIVSKKLKEYLQTDRVARTRLIIDKIIMNIQQVEE